MDNLIDRQAAIDALDEIEAEIAEGLGFEYEKWRKYFCDLPPAQPEPFQPWEVLAVQAVLSQPEIIRCKDCRHRDEFGCCKYWVGLTMGMPTTATDDDDFCSHAERSKT